MHILIGILTAMVGLIWALYRLQNSGVNLNSFNPFYWFRRGKWEKNLHGKQLHRLEKPMDVAAALVVGMIKLEGEISREQKADTIQLFEKEFKLTNAQAVQLFSSSAFSLQDTVNLVAEVKSIVAPSKDKFSEEQTASLLGILKSAAELDGHISEPQRDLLDAVRSELASEHIEQGKWS